MECALFGGSLASPRGGAPGGLLGWLDWLGIPAPALEDLWRPIAQAVREGAAAAHLPRELGDDLGAAVSAMKGAVRAIPWPEALLLERQFDALLAWKDERVERGLLAVQAVRAVEEALERGDEAAAREAVCSAIDALPVKTIQAAHARLLDGLAFGAAMAGRDVGCGWPCGSCRRSWARACCPR